MLKNNATHEIYKSHAANTGITVEKESRLQSFSL